MAFFIHLITITASLKWHHRNKPVRSVIRNGRALASKTSYSSPSKRLSHDLADVRWSWTATVAAHELVLRFQRPPRSRRHHSRLLSRHCHHQNHFRYLKTEGNSMKIIGLCKKIEYFVITFMCSF